MKEVGRNVIQILLVHCGFEFRFDRVPTMSVNQEVDEWMIRRQIRTREGHIRVCSKIRRIGKENVDFVNDLSFQHGDIVLVGEDRAPD